MLVHKRLSVCIISDTELIISGFEQRVWTAGYIGTVSVQRVARLTRTGQTYLVTGDNTSVLSVGVVPPSELGQVTMQSASLYSGSSSLVFGTLSMKMTRGSSVFTDLAVFRSAKGYTAAR